MEFDFTLSSCKKSSICFFVTGLNHENPKKSLLTIDIKWLADLILLKI
jgi:hypothetical protein